MSNFLEISTALSQRFGSLTTTYEKAYPNVQYTPTAETNYLQMSFIPVDTVQAELGTTGNNRNTGICQIDVVFYGQTGFGDAFNEADSVAEHFKRGTRLVNSPIEVVLESVTLGPPINEDGGWFRLPISINYRSDTAN